MRQGSPPPRGPPGVTMKPRVCIGVPVYNRFVEMETLLAHTSEG
jgi:hypothetical protein